MLSFGALKATTYNNPRARVLRQFLVFDGVKATY